MASNAVGLKLQTNDLEAGNRNLSPRFNKTPTASTPRLLQSPSPGIKRRRTAANPDGLAPPDQDNSGDRVFDGDPFQLEKLQKEIDDNLETILKSLSCHKSFTVKEGYEMKNLPKFDDLTHYDVEDKMELELWELEVRRLASAAQSRLPPSLEGESEWFGLCADTEGYSRLQLLVQQFRYALDICNHDNESILVEHCPTLADVSLYETSLRSINHVFDEDTRRIRYGRLIRIKENNDEALHALVNYITAVMVRLLTRSLSGTYWINNTIAVLAKFAAKVKVVTADLPNAFDRCIVERREMQKRLVEAERDRQEFRSAVESIPESNSKALANQQKFLEEDDYTAGRQYFFEMSVFHHSFGSLLRVSSWDLKTDEEYLQRPDEFETCSIIYRTGFQDNKNHLCQERDGSIGVAGNPRVISLAGAAFQVGSEIWRTLPNSTEEHTHATNLTWQHARCSSSPAGSESDQPQYIYEGVREESRCLTNMKDVTQALVPYVLFCGGFSSIMAGFTKVIILTQDSPTPVTYYEQEKITAFAGVTTLAHERKKVAKAAGDRSKSPNHPTKNATIYEAINAAEAVAETDMAKHAREGTCFVDYGEDLKEILECWKIDEKTITINDTWYRVFSLAVASILTLGGLALIAMRGIAEGVDPSNLTALAWAAAGFAMVFLKSRKVQEWPWRDFLQGKIVCRSVTEVQAVTNMDPQKFMAILLRLDARLPLQTRGPYNSLFLTRTSDGFAIDVPLRAETVISAGFIFVRVDSASGPALVAVEASPGGRYDSISVKDMMKEGEGHTCTDLQEPLRHKDGDIRRPLYTLGSVELSWLAIRGVFTGTVFFD